MAEAIAIEAAKGLMQLITARPMEEIRLAWGFKDQLRMLVRKFLYIQAFLEDMGSAKRKMEVQLVNHWLQNVKDVVCFAEDVLDEYVYEILRRKIEQNNSSRKQFRIVFKRSNRIRSRFWMTHKVSEILAKFEEIEKEAQGWGLKAVKLAIDARTSAYHNDNMNEYACILGQARQDANADVSKFIGRKLDEEKLLQMICSFSGSNNPGLSVKAIVGMGGIGKTTLARRIFDKEEVVGHFEKRIWVSVSENFDTKRILKEMVECPTKKSLLSNTHEIVKQLQEEVKSSKFLLVLDDVWNNNDVVWSSLNHSLQKIGDSARSVILVTTRSNEVAMDAEAQPHLLTALSDEESWALFKQQFNTSDTMLDIPCFEEVGRTIVDKCKGVPLAIKMIGRSLKSKRYLHEWEKIETSELWHSEDAKDHILPSLLLSFHHLPTLALKQCFAYCAIFPKNCSMEKVDLVALWLAQGFLHKLETRKLTMEEIGEEFLEILTNNLFIQQIENEITGRIMSYKMHDLVHDLAVYVSLKDLLVWKEEAKLSSDSHYRHLAVNFRLKRALLEFPAEITPVKLRTINLRGGLLRDFFHARYLRTLIADGIGIIMLSPAIGQLKLLRYLDLSNNPIKVLPESITKLYQLQTLKLKGCKQLMELPRELCRLVNLRHILIDNLVYASSGLKQLTCLQTIPNLALRDEGWTIDELGSLPEARDELSISGLEHVKSFDEAQTAGIWRMVKVFRLRFLWSDNREASSSDFDEEVLNGLEPHRDIATLVVGNFNGEKFPSWMMRMAVTTGNRREIRSPLSNLKGIKLVSCKRCRQLPTLGQLPCLNYLYLDTFPVDCIDDHFYVSDQDIHIPAEGLFPALRELRIWNFDNLTKWMQPSLATRVTAFPCLEILEVMDCPLLETIPAMDFISLKCLRIQELAGAQSLDIVKYSSGLTSLEVYDMLSVKSLPDEVLTCTNLQKLNIWSCKQLRSLPNGLQFPVCFKTLDIKECHALSSLPDNLFCGLSSLSKLSILRCNGLKMIPTSLQECLSLNELDIQQCPLIEASIPNLSMLQGLEDLDVVDAGKLTTSVLQALPHLPRLKRLCIGGFQDELEFGNYFVNMAPILSNPSIGVTRLMLEGSPSVKSLPDQIKLLSLVTVLGIRNFDILEELPDWIGKLSSLEELWLYKCKNLKLLPSQQVVLRLTNFWHLRIDDCPLLAGTYAKEGGTKWHDISHLAYILIDDKNVQTKDRN